MLGGSGGELTAPRCCGGWAVFCGIVDEEMEGFWWGEKERGG